MQQLPALTDAESRFVDQYVAVLDALGRLNPANAGGHTYSLVRASQDLAAASTRLRDAVAVMWERGEKEVFAPTLVQALVTLDGQRRTRRLLLP